MQNANCWHRTSQHHLTLFIKFNLYCVTVITSLCDWSVCISEWTVIGYLTEHFSADGKAVCDNRLLISSLTIPTVQLNTAASTQQHLTIHLHRRLASELVTFRQTHRHKQTYRHTHTDSTQQHSMVHLHGGLSSDQTDRHKHTQTLHPTR